MTMRRVISKTCHTEAQERLFRAVVKQVGYWNSIWSYPQDYRDASAGVPGFIWTADCIKFAKRHIEDITEVLADLEEDLGVPLKKTTPVLVWYAWFALEWAAGVVIDFKEGCYE